MCNDPRPSGYLRLQQFVRLWVYLLGQVAAGHAAYAAAVMKSHAAVGAPAQSPDETAAAAAVASERRLDHQRAPLQIAIAVAVSAKPEHVSGQGQGEASKVAGFRLSNSRCDSSNKHCVSMHGLMAPLQGQAWMPSPKPPCCHDCC